MEKKTPLYDSHVALGGRMVAFGGYLMPVQYSGGVIAEHMAVRQRAGVFDVSHMAELTLEGPAAAENIQRLVTTDISGMADGQVKYAILCNEQGGIVDDLVIYRRAADRYLLVVNAGNHDKDRAWISARLSGEVRFRDESDETGQLALQGPASAAILRKICAESGIPQKYYRFCEGSALHLDDGRDIAAIISRTGYTGEFGYEIYCAACDVTALWNTLLRAGAEDGLIPCGLGARDTLRLEAAMPLYGHELDEEISPVEAGLPCKLDGKEFIGRDAILARGEPKIRRIGLRVTGRGIVREHCDLYTPEGKKIGRTTSGTYCPSLQASAAMGYVDAGEGKIGEKLHVDVRGRMIDAEVVPLPFYKATH